MIRFIKRHWSRFKRAVVYFQFGYTNFDWDYTEIYRLLNWKLKRVQRALINGPAEHSRESIAALRSAIKITRRLSADWHERRHIRDNETTILEIYERAKADRDLDLDHLNYILKEYSTSWWD